MYMTPVNALSVVPGEQYYVQVTVIASGTGTSGGAAVGIGILPTGATSGVNVNTTTITTAGTYNLTGTVTIPSTWTTNTAAIRLFVTNGTGGGIFTFSNALVQPATFYSPNITGGVITGTTINGTTINVAGANGGLFVQDGSGNPVASIDGNLSAGYPSNLGIISWQSGGFAALSGARLLFGNGTPSAQLTVQQDGPGLLITPGGGYPSGPLWLGHDGFVHPAQPGTSTMETWHPLTLINNWVNQGSPNVAAQYRLTAENDVQVVGVINGVSAVSATFATLPTGYHPVNQQPAACGATGNVATGKAPFIQCDTSGNLTVQGAAALPASGPFVFDVRFSMNA
jgi:hypothetical protein